MLYIQAILYFFLVLYVPIITVIYSLILLQKQHVTVSIYIDPFYLSFYNFSIEGEAIEDVVTLDWGLSMSEHFKYLESILQRDKNIDQEVRDS